MFCHMFLAKCTCAYGLEWRNREPKLEAVCDLSGGDFTSDVYGCSGDMCWTM